MIPLQRCSQRASMADFREGEYRRFVQSARQDMAVKAAAIHEMAHYIRWPAPPIVSPHLASSPD